LAILAFAAFDVLVTEEASVTSVSRILPGKDTLVA
jgi:hypothetical protein